MGNLEENARRFCGGGDRRYTLGSRRRKREQRCKKEGSQPWVFIQPAACAPVKLRRPTPLAQPKATQGATRTDFRRDPDQGLGTDADGRRLSWARPADRRAIKRVFAAQIAGLRVTEAETRSAAHRKRWAPGGTGLRVNFKTAYNGLYEMLELWYAEVMLHQVWTPAWLGLGSGLGLG